MINVLECKDLGIVPTRCTSGLNNLWIKPDGSVIVLDSSIQSEEAAEEIVEKLLESQFEEWKQVHESSSHWEDYFLLDIGWSYYSYSIGFLFWKTLTDDQKETIKEQLGIADLP